MSADLLTSGLRELGLGTQSDRIGKIQQLYCALVRWNRVFNLTAVHDKAGFIGVHVLDSLSVYPYLHGSRILDVGSGAGFPGLPLAVFFPERSFVLLDAVAKKIRFIHQMVLQLGLDNVEVIHARVEHHVDTAGFTTIVTRAFAEAGKAFSLCRHLLSPQGKFLAMKGRYPHTELSALGDLSHRVLPLQVPGLQGRRHLIEISESGYS